MRKSTLCIVVLFVVVLIGWSPENTEAQSSLADSVCTVRFENERLDSAILRLQNNLHLGVSYNPDIFSREIRVTGIYKKVRLETILDSLLHPNHLTYKIIGRNIAIGRMGLKLIRGQRADSVRTTLYASIDGCVMDSVTREPIPYANVYIRANSIGNICNTDGNFILKIPDNFTFDSLYFSCLGYKTKALQISGLLYRQNRIYLQPVPVMIREVVVKNIDVHKLLREAISKIHENYSRIPSLNTAFYRETIKENRDYVNLSEAVLHIYKASYSSYLNDQINIFKARKSEFVKKMDTLYFKFQGGPFNCLLLDIAKNPSNFLAEEYMPFYDFKFDDIVSIDDRATYVISFDQKDDAPYPLFKGKLYIDRRTLAFVRADFQISPRGMDMATQELVQRSPWRVRVKPLVAKYLVNYDRSGNTWYLNNIHEELAFRVHKKFTFFTKVFHTEADLVITKIDTLNVHRFRRHDVVSSRDVFIDEIGSYDESFWGEYNILKPDVSLEEALKRVKKKIQDNPGS